MQDTKCEVKRDAHGRVIYRPGDIVGVWGTGIPGWMNRNFITPRTPMYHFLLIGDVVPGYSGSDDIFKDYVTLESVNKGVTVGRLSWYKNRPYNVYRLNREDFNNRGYTAYTSASLFGRHGYDWGLVVGLFFTWVRHGFRRLSVREIPYQRDNNFLCTELVFEAYRLAGVLLRQSGHAPLPGEIVLAERRGQIVLIDYHFGIPAIWREPVAGTDAELAHTFEVDKATGADVLAAAAAAGGVFTVGQDCVKNDLVYEAVTGTTIGIAGQGLKAGDLVSISARFGRVLKVDAEAEPSADGDGLERRTEFDRAYASMPEPAPKVDQALSEISTSYPAFGSPFQPGPEPAPKPSMTPTYVGLLRHGQHGRRERSHIFVQPEGRPIRVCNRERVDETDFRPLYVATARMGRTATEIHDGMRQALTCQKCLNLLLKVGTSDEAGKRIFPKTYYGGR